MALKLFLSLAFLAVVASNTLKSAPVTLNERLTIDELLNLQTNPLPAQQTTQKPIVGDNLGALTEAEPEVCGLRQSCAPYHLCQATASRLSLDEFLDIELGPSTDTTPTNPGTNQQGGNQQNNNQGTNQQGGNQGQSKTCLDTFETCCDDGGVLETTPTEITNPEKTKQGCGFRNENGIAYRITGGSSANEAEYAEFPWMVAVLRQEIAAQNQINNYFECGGSLLHPKVIVTAAHCLVKQKNPQNLVVRAGEWDTQSTKEIFPYADRMAQEMIIHPQYYKGGLHNDVALLIVQQPFELAQHINTICLPAQGTSFDGSRCLASGWGKDVFGKEGIFNVILKKIELPIVQRNTCQNNLRTTRLGQGFNLHASFICAGGEAGRDTCRGDGGSPLVCPIAGAPGRYYQAGIVSWGIGCGEQGIPGLYANMALFRTWIDQQMNAKGFGITSYSLQ